MRNLFIVKFKDGGPLQAMRMRVDKSGNPTKKEYERLDAMGYCEWINLDNKLASPLPGELEAVARELGMII